MTGKPEELRNFYLIVGELPKDSMDIWAFFETPNSRKRRCYISGRLANKTSLNDVFWKGQNYCQNFEKQYSSKTWYLIPTEIVLHRTNGSRVLIKYLSMDPRKRIGNFRKLKPLSWRKSSRL